MKKNYAFEQLVYSFLKTLDFKMVRYYPYESIADILGYMNPPAPLKIPIKVAIEIVDRQVTGDFIQRFRTISKNSVTERSIVFAAQGITPEGRDLANRYRIEVILRKDLEDIVKKVDKQITEHYERISDIVSPMSLAKMLPEIAQQKMPNQLKAFVGENLEPWQLFEESVYSIFRHCFHYNVRQLGSVSLFEREPEGVVGVDDKFAFIYECKSAKEAYHMTVDDERAYVEYIEEKKNEVRALDKSDLKYFVVLSPDFKGDLEERRDRIYGETTVLIVFMKASSLSILGQWVYNLPPNMKGLVNLTRVFKISQLVVSDDLVEEKIKLFEKKYRSRW